MERLDLICRKKRLRLQRSEKATVHATQYPLNS
ncbi:hypothetical protein COLO4_36873 [Corchorus olitorius]|uniref:Uncharacterized protein n=1 Tax=Corchorus olitorius TaxID=93759 RepID=A0A1R3G4L6_9ROSI|nr:hypothetical protein COLO4_36873 [Corchorus olitorius]